MIANRSVPADTVLPHVVYRDVAEAIAWLTKTFGFAEHYRYGEPGGPISGAQMHLGNAWIMVNRARAGRGSPAHLGCGTQSQREKRSRGELILEFLRDSGMARRVPTMSRYSWPVRLGIEIGFLGDVAETFSIGGEVFVDVLAVVGDFAVGRLEQAREHFCGSALSGTVRTQVAENLAGLKGEGYVLDGGNGAIEFVQPVGCEHQAFLVASGQVTAGVCGQLVGHRRVGGGSHRGPPLW